MVDEHLFGRNRVLNHMPDSFEINKRSTLGFLEMSSFTALELHKLNFGHSADRRRQLEGRFSSASDQEA